MTYYGVLDNGVPRRDLVRDSRNKAILNRDIEALNRYKQERAQAQKAASLEKELEEVKRDVVEIKAGIAALISMMSNKQ